MVTRLKDWPVDAASSNTTETTRAILSKILETQRQRNFAVRLWNGQTVFSPASGVEPEFTLILNHPGALRRMFFPPGELTLAESYLRGDFDIEGDIVASMKAGLAFDNLTLRDWLNLARQVYSLPATEPEQIFRDGRQPARLRGRRHSRERDRAAISYHYDVSNEFYRMFLGQWMTYSCAYFPTRDTELDTAQAAKLAHICRKLRLRPGERLLDIGCGWGGLAVYAARNFGVQVTGITLSRPQVEYGQDWVRRVGLTGQVNIEWRDYRDLDPRYPFDKIASIGMFEHVGEARLPEYFQSAFRVLRPGGLFLNHGIAVQNRAQPNWIERALFHRSQFIQRYIFPDGELVPVSCALDTAEQTGFEVRDVENLREHYALTLRHWIRNLEARRPEAVRQTNARTCRTWRLYMAVSAQGFESGFINVFQALLSKNNNGRAQIPLTRADLYTRDLRS